MLTPQNPTQMYECTHVPTLAKYARFQHNIAMVEFCSQKSMIQHIEIWEKREEQSREELTILEARWLEAEVMADIADNPIHQVVDLYGGMLDVVTREFKAYNSQTYGNRY